MYRLLLPACLAIPVFSANAADASDVWKPEQLNESYMRSQSKHQCMEKTISTLKFYCKDAACVNNLSGIVGDCVNWASGTDAEFCLNYDKRYVARYCLSNYLDGRSCGFLHVAKNVLCKDAKK